MSSKTLQAIVNGAYAHASVILFGDPASGNSSIKLHNIRHHVTNIKLGDKIVLLTELYYLKSGNLLDLVASNVDTFSTCGCALLYSIGCTYFLVKKGNIITHTLKEPVLQVSQGDIGFIRKFVTLNLTQTKDYKTDFTEDEIVDMQGGENHVLVLTNTGKVFSYGQNKYGTIGRQSKNDQPFAQVQFPNNEKVRQIVCGRLFSFCLVDGHTLYGFGVNNYSQLGLPNKHDDYFEPTRVDLSSISGEVIKVYCGGYQTMLKTTFGWYGIGTSSYNSLFLQDIDSRHDSWKLLDQPFCNDGSQFSVSMGHGASVAYIKYKPNMTFSMRSRSNFQDISIKCY